MRFGGTNFKIWIFEILIPKYERFKELKLKKKNYNGCLWLKRLYTHGEIHNEPFKMVIWAIRCDPHSKTRYDEIRWFRM